jgi:hypothetical protein
MGFTKDENPDSEVVNFYCDQGAKILGIVFNIARGTLKSK